MLFYLICAHLCGLLLARIYENHRVIRCQISADDLTALNELSENNLDIWKEARYNGDFHDIMLSEEDYAELKGSLQVNCRTIIDDVQRLIDDNTQNHQEIVYADANSNINLTWYQSYHSDDNVHQYLDELVNLTMY